jgi:cell division protein YceG involved in septum cleavage
VSDGTDWGDPFTGDDEAARERARRRAEREARRAAAAGGAPAPVETPPSAAPSATAVAESPSPASADGHDVDEPVDEPVDGPAPRRHRSPRGRPPPGVVHRRRLFAFFGLLGLAFVVLVVFALATRNGGGGDALVAPTKERKTVEVVVPEGFSRDQIAGVAKKAGIKGDYAAASKSAKGFNPAKWGAENPESLEGFLFPATYQQFKNAKATDLVKAQLDAFTDNVAGVDFGYARSKNLTKFEVLTIASMVEREVSVPEERAKVAAVIYNRLAAGMPLQIDATVRYATGNFDEPVKESELQNPSPYNTYVNPGLPPGPIGNPGLASIEAAAKPTKDDFLFYVIKPGTCGEHVFTASEDEFNQAVAAYRQAQEQAGGSPTEC